MHRHFFCHGTIKVMHLSGLRPSYAIFFSAKARKSRKRSLSPTSLRVTIEEDLEDNVSVINPERYVIQLDFSCALLYVLSTNIVLCTM